jgi:hypothetical protein
MQLGGGEEGCKDPRNPPATGHQVRGRAAPSPSHSSPPFPSTEPSSSEVRSTALAFPIFDPVITGNQDKPELNRLTHL